MDYLQIALVVLVVVGVWAVVEVALTMRRARRDIERLASSAIEVIEQVQPVVSKLDGMMDELEPAAKRAVPLMVSVEQTVETATGSLERVNGILEDVSSVSGTASSVTGAVNRVAESAASGVASVVSRLRGGSAHEPAARLEGAQDAPAASREPEERVRYVDYGSLSADASAAADAGSDASASASPSDDAPKTPQHFAGAAGATPEHAESE